MKCKKKAFQSAEEAEARAGQINSSNKKTKKQNELLRSYKCKDCGNWHLTSMKKHQYLYANNVKYRNKINEKSFIKKESEYWEDYFSKS